MIRGPAKNGRIAGTFGRTGLYYAITVPYRWDGEPHGPVPGTGKKMKAYTIAAISIAVVAMMCICPFAVMADDGDAVSVNTGEKGISVKAENMSKEDINKLFSASAQTALASEVFNSFSSTAYFSISAVEISTGTVERALSAKITDNSSYYSKATNQKFTMTFKATCTNANNIFDNTEAYAEAIRAVGTNTATVGDVFEVSVEGTTTTYDMICYEFIKNVDGNLVVKVSEDKTYNTVKYDVTAKYKYTKDTAPAETDIEFKAFTESEEYQKKTYDFNGASDTQVRATTKAFVSYDFVYANSATFDCDVKGGKSTSVSYYLDYSPMMEAMAQAFTLAEVLDIDQTLPTFNYVGIDDETSLFQTSEVTGEVNTDETMKAFFQNAGTVSEAYSDARSMADDNDGSVVNPSDALNLLLIIGIAAVGILAVFFLVLFILAMIFRRRKK